jgi:hypothetical protein
VPTDAEIDPAISRWLRPLCFSRSTSRILRMDRRSDMDPPSHQMRCRRRHPSPRPKPPPSCTCHRLRARVQVRRNRCSSALERPLKSFWNQCSSAFGTSVQVAPEYADCISSRSSLPLTLVPLVRARMIGPGAVGYSGGWMTRSSSSGVPRRAFAVADAKAMSAD